MEFKTCVSFSSGLIRKKLIKFVLEYEQENITYKILNYVFIRKKLTLLTCFLGLLPVPSPYRVRGLGVGLSTLSRKKEPCRKNENLYNLTFIRRDTTKSSG